jgi:hypothetical protein
MAEAERESLDAPDRFHNPVEELRWRDPNDVDNPFDTTSSDLTGALD